jgi:hypothetical protein
LIFLSSSLEGVEILVIFRAIRKEKKMVRTKGIGKMLTLISLALFAASLPAFCPSAEGAATFPKKPVTLICIYDAGSTSDIIIRSFADLLSKELGQKVLVANKVGGTGTLGPPS